MRSLSVVDSYYGGLLIPRKSRFVNGFVDQAQRGMYAASAAAVAEQLGLPGWFVELRHAGTHDQLPTLQLLRSGCQQVGDSCW